MASAERPPQDRSGPALAWGSGVRLAWEEHGAGMPCLLVHGGETGGRSAWRELVAALGGALRAIAYDRRGWGDSEAPVPYLGTSVEEQAEDAAALAGSLGLDPVVLCGEGIGALVCLDLLCRHPGLARAALLIEPPLASLSRRGSEHVAELRDAVEEGARAGGPAGAVDALLVEVGGERAPAVLGHDRLAALRRQPRVVFAELAAINGWGYTRSALRRVAVPVTIVAGTRSHPVRREAARALAQLLPRCELREPDAGPAAAIERPEDVAAWLGELAAR